MCLQQYLDGLRKCMVILIMTSQASAASTKTVNIAKLATLTATSLVGYDKEFAVDGKVDVAPGDIDICRCCFVSTWENNPNFTARLPGHYNVQQITIVGRQFLGGINQELSNITVHLDNITASVSLDTVANTATVTPMSPSVQTIHISRPHSQADKGWFLIICELRVTVSGTNIAKLASLNASPFLSYIYNFTKEKAVDGIVSQNTEMCECCSSSDSRIDPFFTAAFDRQYNIVDILIEGRRDRPPGVENSNLQGITAQIDEKNEFVSVDATVNQASVIPSPPLRNITIQRPGSRLNWFLMICELRVYVAECVDGYYGDSCDNDCPPNCDRACDTITGHCTNGCVAGFLGDNCDILCPNGTFGRNCSHTCHCKDNLPCNASAGFCANGCAAGFTGYSCNKTCPDGSYGDYCVHSCRCMNNATCNKALGNCSNGCDYARSGFNCSTDNNLLSFIENNVSTNMSSIYSDFGPALAIDGSYDLMSPTFDDCKCCSATDGSEKPWWQIDLGSKYLIREIYVIGRQRGGLEQSANLVSYISNSSAVDGTQRTLLKHTSLKGTVYHYNYSDPNLFRYITIRRNTPATTTMAVCEVKLIEGVCPYGTFGANCSLECHCLNGANCDNVDGDCVNHLCEPGWRTTSCSEVCMHGTFGFNCTLECHCLSNASCNNAIGTCDNGICAPGWQYESCSEVCPYGFFGANCSVKCHCLNGANCDNVHGECDNHLCAPGWRTNSCSEVCRLYQFGPNCSFTCHCLARAACNNVDGRCVSGECSAGWLGQACDIACPAGNHGLKCTHKCGFCDGYEPCDTETGICTHGCVPGFTGLYCVDTENEDNPLNGPLFGGLTALVLCLIIAIIIIVVYFKRRMAKSRRADEHASTDNTYTKPEMYVTPTENSVYDTLSDPDTYEMTTQANTYENTLNY